MSQSISGNVALITGAARGQGRAHAGRLAADIRDLDALKAAADTYPHLRGLHKPLLPDGSAQPEDIADAVARLASDQSRLVTATQVSVDIGVGYV